MRAYLRSLLRKWCSALDKARRFWKIRHVPLRTLRRWRLCEPELKLVDVLLDGEPGLCLDIGAHVGEYCYVLEGCVAAAQVHAFEPNPKSCVRLRALFPNIHVWNVALSDEIGSAPFKIPSIDGSPYPTRGTLEAFAEPGESGSEVTQVRTTTLDAFSEQLGGGPVSFLKVDVEGHERKVLAGGMEMIEAHRPIMLVEIEQRHHEEAISEIFREIEGLGYSGCFLDLNEGRFASVDRFDAAKMQRYDDLKSAGYVNNFIFVPNSRAPRVLQRLEKTVAEAFVGPMSVASTP